MNNYENEYRDSENENYEYNTEMESGYEFENESEDEYNNEFEEEEELSSEFENESEDEYQGEYEGEDEYQQEDEFQNEDEYEEEFQNEGENEYEYEGENEYEDEYEYENEEEAEYEAANEYESPRRQPQRNTFSPGVKSFNSQKSRTRPGWVPVRVPTRSPINKYRYNSRLRPATPWYIRARNNFGIAMPSRYHRRHPHRHWRNRYGNYPYNSPLSNSNLQTAVPPFPGTAQQSNPNMSGGSMQQPNLDMSGGSTAQPQDGNFQTYILDTLKSLSAQIAASNESIASLKNSLPNNPQQPGGGMDAPAPMTTPPTQTKEEGPKSGEYEMENYEYNMEYEGEVTDREGSFNEMTEMELASELLNINNESELNYFLGSLVKKAVGVGLGILKTPEGKMLAGALKNVARKALKPAGAAIGTAIGGPLGTQIGASVGDAASKMFELEMEGLSQEDREFEAARSVVRFSGNAVKQLTEQDSGDPQEDARQALIQASILYAPGLIIRRGNHYRPNNRGGRRRY